MSPADSNGVNSEAGVYEFLKERIMEGSLKPGEKLNERELARQANVSRTPVREALKRLEHEGFVENLRQRGAFVKKYSPEELDVLHQMLFRMESLALELSAPKLRDRDFAKLREMLSLMQADAAEHEPKHFISLNMAFHLFFAEKTGSAELTRTIDLLLGQIMRLLYVRIAVGSDATLYIEEHREILDSLQGKSEKSPVETLEKHLERSRRSVLRFYENLELAGK
jgi:DNA-binding GntR family transcriptional regulator